MNTKHTPLPWVFAYGAIYRDLPNLQAENSGIRIAQMDRNEPHTMPVERDANAAYIVKAVNAHDELVGALENAIAALDCAIDFLGDDCDYGIQDLKASAVWLPKIKATAKAARSILAKVI